MQKYSAAVTELAEHAKLRQTMMSIQKVLWHEAVCDRRLRIKNLGAQADIFGHILITTSMLFILKKILSCILLFYISKFCISYFKYIY